MSHGPCEAACAEPVTAAGPASAPSTAATAAPRRASLVRRGTRTGRRTAAASRVCGHSPLPDVAGVRCFAPGPRLAHVPLFMLSPCSTSSTIHVLLALTSRPCRDTGPRQVAPRCSESRHCPALSALSRCANSPQPSSGGEPSSHQAHTQGARAISVLRKSAVRRGAPGTCDAFDSKQIPIRPKVSRIVTRVPAVELDDRPCAPAALLLPENHPCWWEPMHGRGRCCARWRLAEARALGNAVAW